MNIIYEGKDISNYVDVTKADIYDNAGGVADSIELHFSDTLGLWSKWKPKKGHKIEVKEKGCSSGLMFIDHMEQGRGKFIIKALSTPTNAKTENTKGWEKASLLNVAGEISSKYGFVLSSYGVKDQIYDRLDQIEQADFDFLANRAMLEGNILKIFNQKVVIYGEAYMEQQAAVKDIISSDLDGDYLFKTISIGLFNSCIINSSSGDIKVGFKPSNAPPGPILKKSMYLANIAEGQRYSKGILRAANKYEHTGKITVNLDTELASGININIKEFGYADGKYFIDKAIHKLVEQKTILKLRRPLEGY